MVPTTILYAVVTAVATSNFLVGAYYVPDQPALAIRELVYRELVKDVLVRRLIGQPRTGMYKRADRGNGPPPRRPQRAATWNAPPNQPFGGLSRSNTGAVHTSPERGEGEPSGPNLEKLSVLRKAQKSIALNPNEAKGEMIEKTATSSLALAGGAVAGTIAANNGQPAVATSALAAGVGSAAANIAGQTYKMASRFDKAVQEGKVDAQGNPKPKTQRRSLDYDQQSDDSDVGLLRRELELQNAFEDSYWL